MSQKLRELIRQVRACKTASEERAVISKECAMIRTAFKDEDSQFRHRNVAKLLFIHMLGYPSHFGQMECLKLIASTSFAEKRIGYLGLMLLLTEKDDTLTLVTNSLKNDLNHNNRFVAGLSLAAVGNIASTDIARDLVGDVDKNVRSENNYLRKKGALTMIRIFTKVPDLVEDFMDRIVVLVKDRSHGVVLSGLELLLATLQLDARHKPYFLKLVPSLVRLLRNMLSAGYTPEHDVSGIADPFLQVKILQVLCELGRGDAEASDAMNDILAQVATNTETAKNAGNAILYQCVQTIMSIESEGGLRVLAVNILGRFLLNRDNNIRYVALHTLSKVVTQDIAAVQRHRNTIVDCLKDPDVSIRQRALELIYALTNETNIRALAREMLNYLVVCSADQRGDLCSKIADVVDKYSPDKRWQVDTLITTISIAGSECQQNERIVNSLVCLITQVAELHPYIVHKLYHALKEDLAQQALVHVGIWCVGEFGQLLGTAPPTDEGATPKGPVSESDIVDLVHKVMRLHSATVTTKSFCLNALLKLTTRLTGDEVQARLSKLIRRYQHSMDLELQQRSVEYSNLLKPEWGAVKPDILEQMPVLDLAAMNQRRAERQASMGFSDSDDDYEDRPKRGPVVVGAAAPGGGGGGGGGGALGAPPAAGGGGGNLVDLDDIFGGGGGGGAAPAPAAPTGGADLLADIFAAPAPAPVGGAAPVMDLMGGMGAPAPAQQMQAPAAPMIDLMGGMGAPAPVQQQMQPAAPQPAAPAPAPVAVAGASASSFVAYQGNGTTISFSCAPVAGNANGTKILASFANANGAPMENLQMQCAVPKYIQLQMSPASATAVPPGSNGAVTQQVNIINTMRGQKPVMMKLKLSWSCGGQNVSELASVGNFPAGL